MKKKIFKKIAVLFCLVALVASSMPTYAAGNHTEPIEYSVSKVNPIYADTVSKEEIVVSSENQPTTTFSVGKTYTTVEDAGAYLREQMVARSTMVTVSYQTESNDWDALTDTIFEVALEHTGNPCEGDYLAFQWKGYNCSISYSYDGSTYDADLSFAITYYTDAEQEITVTDKVEEVLASLSLDDKTEYEKIKAIYDYVCNNVDYDYTNLKDDDYVLKYTAYAALINKTSVCQGYANLMYRLLLEEGIDARIISGVSNGEGHAWNIVKLEDVYYNIDATWDANHTDDYQYFMKTNEEFTNHTRDEEYLTEEFRTKYVMSKESFIISDDDTGTTPLNEYIESISIDKKLVSEGETITFTVIPKQDYEFGFISLKKPITGNSTTVSLEKVGDALIGTMSITDQTESGEWQIQYIALNVADWSYIHVYDKNFPLADDGAVDFSNYSFEVYGTNADVIAPQITSMSIDKKVISASETVTISVCVNEENPKSWGNMSYCTPDGEWQVVKLDLIEDTSTYQGTYTIQEADLCGDWRPRYISIEDLNENETIIWNKNVHSNEPNEDLSYLDFKVVSISEDSSTTDGPFTVIFNDGYDGIICTQLVNKNEAAIAPENPTRDRYIFAGWDIDFSNVTSNLSVTAQWENNPSCGEKLTWKLTEYGVLTISGTGSMDNWNAFDGNLPPWLDYKDSVKKIVIEEGVDTIGAYAFYAFNNLSSIHIPEGVSKISGSAFCFCTNLTSIDIATSVTEIEESAFQSCSSLTSVSLPEGITYIGGHTFAGCTNLYTITIPKSVVHIGQGAFSGCDNLSDVTYAGSVCMWNNINIQTHNTPLSKEIITFKLGEHQWAESYRMPSGCETPGEVGYECSLCGETKTLTIDPTGHSFDEGFPKLNQDCMNPGEIYYECQTCGFSKTEYIPIQEHSYGEWTIEKAATDTEEGSKTRICSACGKVEKQVIEKVTYDQKVNISIGDTEETTLYFRNDYGVSIVSEDPSIVGASLTGTSYSFTASGAYYGKTFALAGYKEGATKVVVYNGGYEVEVYYVVVSAPTTSISVSKCSPYTIEITTLQDETFSIKNTENVSCNITSKKKTTSSTSINGVTSSTTKYTYKIALNFKTAGTENFTLIGSSSGDVYNINATISNHVDVTDKAVEVTCTSTGLTEGAHCSVCNAIIKAQTVIPASGHETELKGVKEATCTKKGYTGDSVCKVCEETIGLGEEVPMVAHSYDTGVITTEATCEEAGIRTYTCEVCKGTKIEEVKALGHDYSEVWTVDKEATCTEEGSKSIHCRVCDTIKEGSAVSIPKLEKEELRNPFLDNKEGEFYYEPVLWAYQSGITTGYSATEFKPNNTCTRGQVVTFLWRAVGKPAYSASGNPFSDVLAGEFYYEPVLWAVKNGVTTGLPGGIFGPDREVTREQFVTFLWRAAGKPAPTSNNNPFPDVIAGEFYYDAVLWAVENGVTTGYPNGTFGTGDTCTRGQVVTFLYRAYGE